MTEEKRSACLWTGMACAGLGLLGPLLALCGGWAWVLPLACLPAAVGVAELWRRLGDISDLPRPLRGVYLLWGLVLLAASAGASARRLLLSYRGENPWLYLIAGAALCLWLCGREGKIPCRTGRLLFLPAAAVLLVLLALSLPGLRWENLGMEKAPEGKELAQGFLLCLSLSGYGVYGLSLPGRAGGKTWRVSLCALLSALLLSLGATFGPVLAAGRQEPVLLLLEGAQVPGIFRHGEAALESGLSLGELVLLMMLAYGCRAVAGRTGLLLAAGAILTGGFLPNGAAKLVPIGNLTMGVLVPIVVLWGRGQQHLVVEGIVTKLKQKKAKKPLTNP